MKNNHISLPDLVMDNNVCIPRSTKDALEPKLRHSNHYAARGMLQLSKNIPSSYLSQISPNHGSQPMSLPSSSPIAASLVAKENSTVPFSQTNRISQEELRRPSQYTGEIGELRSICEIPPEYRGIFSKYPSFNVIQSKALDILLYSDRPLVISAPTGSGKTVIFELAIVNLLMKLSQENYKGDFKIVYMAPVKALCTERYHDWQEKFSHLGLKCHEVTGDSYDSSVADLQNYNLVLTTPEKWDSLTRKWRQNKQLVQLVKLFLIDEVHLLNEEKRGPVLEAVVSRMKTVQETLSFSKHNSAKNCGIQIPIRFIAVSATIPNIEDLAVWLGDGFRPAEYIKIGEEYRPVKLNKVVLGFPTNFKQNPFQFDMNLNYYLRDLLFKYAGGKPSLIFCSTRKGVTQTAQTLAKEITFHFNATQRQSLMFSANNLVDKKLRDSVLAGVGSHHAGMDASDRHTIENLFRSLLLPVLVSTSTLAMGVNLPAHLVIVKSTQQYFGGIYQDYSETQLLQMIGRAGRPQFDTTATAIIMTRQQDKARYERLVDGQDLIESTLHRHLAEHLNAEVVLETITEVCIAMNWLRSTFLYVRALKNPIHYGFPKGLSETEITNKLQDLCLYEMNGLSSANLLTIVDGLDIRPTDKGRLMASFYLSVETMKIFNKITGTESLNEMILVVASCQEFSDLQLRRVEKRVLNELNKIKDRECIRFPIKGIVRDIPMKVNVLIQATLGCLPINDHSLYQDSLKIMRVGERITRSLTKFLLNEGHYNSLLNAVLLAKCIHSKLWENSIYVTKQLHRIGAAYSSLLASAGKTTFQSILTANPRDLERILNKAPPLGNDLKTAAIHLPKYNIEMKLNDLQNEASMTLRLENLEDIANFSTAGHNHWLTVIAGNNTNKVLHKERLNDNQLLQMDGVVSWCIPIDTTEVTEIYGHVISDNWVGIDKDVTVKITQLRNKHGNILMKKAIEQYVTKMGLPNPLTKSTSAKKDTSTASKPKKLTIVEQIRQKGRQLPALGVKLSNVSTPTPLMQTSLDRFLYTPAKKSKLPATYDQFINQNVFVSRKLHAQNFLDPQPSTSTDDSYRPLQNVNVGKNSQDSLIQGTQPSTSNEYKSHVSDGRKQGNQNFYVRNSMRDHYRPYSVPSYESYSETPVEPSRDDAAEDEDTRGDQIRWSMNTERNKLKQQSHSPLQCYSNLSFVHENSAMSKEVEAFVEEISSDDDEDLQWVKTYHIEEQDRSITTPSTKQLCKTHGRENANPNEDLGWTPPCISPDKMQPSARAEYRPRTMLEAYPEEHQNGTIPVTSLYSNSPETYLSKQSDQVPVKYNSHYCESFERTVDYLRRMKENYDELDGANEECESNIYHEKPNSCPYSDRQDDRYVTDSAHREDDQYLLCNLERARVFNEEKYPFTHYKDLQTQDNQFLKDAAQEGNDQLLQGYDKEFAHDFNNHADSTSNRNSCVQIEDYSYQNNGAKIGNYEECKDTYQESVRNFMDKRDLASSSCSGILLEDGPFQKQAINTETYQDVKQSSGEGERDFKREQNLPSDHFSDHRLLVASKENKVCLSVASTPELKEDNVVNKECQQQPVNDGIANQVNDSVDKGLAFEENGNNPEDKFYDMYAKKLLASGTDEKILLPSKIDSTKESKIEPNPDLKLPSSQSMAKYSNVRTEKHELPVEEDPKQNISTDSSEKISFCFSKQFKGVAERGNEESRSTLPIADSGNDNIDEDSLGEKPKMPKHYFPIFMNYDLTTAQESNTQNENSNKKFADEISCQKDGRFRNIPKMIFDTNKRDWNPKAPYVAGGTNTSNDRLGTTATSPRIPKLAFDLDLDALLDSIDISDDSTCKSRKESPNLRRIPLMNKTMTKCKPNSFTKHIKRNWDRKDPLMVLFYGSQEKKINKPAQSKEFEDAPENQTCTTSPVDKKISRVINEKPQPTELDGKGKNQTNLKDLGKLQTINSTIKGEILTHKKENSNSVPQEKLFAYCAGRKAKYLKPDTHKNLAIKCQEIKQVTKIPDHRICTPNPLINEPKKQTPVLAQQLNSRCSKKFNASKSAPDSENEHFQHIQYPRPNTSDVHEMRCVNPGEHSKAAVGHQENSKCSKGFPQSESIAEGLCERSQHIPLLIQHPAPTAREFQGTKSSSLIPSPQRNVSFEPRPPTTEDRTEQVQQATSPKHNCYAQETSCVNYFSEPFMHRNEHMLQTSVLACQSISRFGESFDPSTSIDEVRKEISQQIQFARQKTGNFLETERSLQKPEMAHRKVSMHLKVINLNVHCSESFNTSTSTTKDRRESAQYSPLKCRFPGQSVFYSRETNHGNPAHALPTQRAGSYQYHQEDTKNKHLSCHSPEVTPEIFSQCSNNPLEDEKDGDYYKPKFKWDSSQESFTQRSAVDSNYFPCSNSQIHDHEQHFGDELFISAKRKHSQQYSSSTTQLNYHVDGKATNTINDWEKKVVPCEVDFPLKKLEYNHTQTPRDISTRNAGLSPRKRRNAEYEFGEIFTDAQCRTDSKFIRYEWRHTDKIRSYEYDTRNTGKLKKICQGVFEETQNVVNNSPPREMYHHRLDDGLNSKNIDIDYGDSLPNQIKHFFPNTKSTQIEKDYAPLHLESEAKRSYYNYLHKYDGDNFDQFNRCERGSFDQSIHYGRENLNPLPNHGGKVGFLDAMSENIEASFPLQSLQLSTNIQPTMNMQQKNRLLQSPPEHESKMPTAIQRQEMFQYCKKRTPGSINSAFNQSKPKLRRTY